MNDSDLLAALFPNLSSSQLDSLGRLPSIYKAWNEKLNLISRKDIDNVMLHHILHSLFIMKAVTFREGDSVLDFGTGGGFPGIPLAAAFPDVHFQLIDSVAKKVRAVEAIAQQAGLTNVTCLQIRGEELQGEYSFVVSRAVADLSQLWRWSRHLVKRQADRHPANGLLVLKGGAISPEVAPFGKRATSWRISDWTDLPYFQEKYLVLVSAL